MSLLLRESDKTNHPCRAIVPRNRTRPGSGKCIGSTNGPRLEPAVIVALRSRPGPFVFTIQETICHMVHVTTLINRTTNRREIIPEVEIRDEREQAWVIVMYILPAA